TPARSRPRRTHQAGASAPPGPRCSWRVGLRAAAAQHGADDERNDQYAQRREQVVLIAVDLDVDGGDVVARRIADTGPQPDPQRRAERVEGEELAPGHLGGTGDDAVGLAQAFHEARDRDDLAAVAGEE